MRMLTLWANCRKKLGKFLCIHYDTVDSDKTFFFSFSLQNNRALVKGDSTIKKDLVVIMSQILCAAATLISKGTVPFMQQLTAVFCHLYNEIKLRSSPKHQYRWDKFFIPKCCTSLDKHIALQLMDVLRIMFEYALQRNEINDYLVSLMSNYAVGEAQIISNFDCPEREKSLNSLRQTVVFVTNSIDKIETVCGTERAIRTLHRFLTLDGVIDKPTSKTIFDRLWKFCETTQDQTLLIDTYAMWVMLYGNNKKNLIFYMHKLHSCQSELKDAEKFETISSIVGRLPKKWQSVKLSLIGLQFEQMSTEIRYPKLPEPCLEKMVSSMRKMDPNSDPTFCYGNLFKSGICRLECKMSIARYESNVKFVDYRQPLDGTFVSINNEIEIVQHLLEALNLLSEFFNEKDVWISRPDRNDYIPFAEDLLQFIAEMLINRHYKEMATAAFDLYYRFAKLLNNPFKQMIAAGFLVENFQHLATVPEVEMATELQTTVLQKLRDVTTMSEKDLGSFLLSFLQLTMYTLRHQGNIDHTKKYLLAINRLLKRFDSEKKKYLAAQLKYAEVMFEVIVKDSQSSVTPITFVEDIFDRFRNIRDKTQSEYMTVAGIVFDLMSTVYGFTQPRHEFRMGNAFGYLLQRISISCGYVFLLAKTMLLMSRESLRIGGSNLEVRTYFFVFNQIRVNSPCYDSQSNHERTCGNEFL